MGEWLTEPEMGAMKLQGREIGPTVGEVRLWTMSEPELREMQFNLIADQMEAKNKVWYQRQIEKIRREMKRRDRCGSQREAQGL